MSAEQYIVAKDKGLLEAGELLLSYIKGSFPLININSSEYDRILFWLFETFFKSLSEKITDIPWTFYLFDSSQGLQKYEMDKFTIIPGTTEIEIALHEFLNKDISAILVTKNLHFFWEDNYRKPKIIDFLFKIFDYGISKPLYLINIGEASVPQELRHYFVTIDIPLPDEDTIKETILAYFKDKKLKKDILNEAINLCKGMTLIEIQNNIVFSYVHTGNLDIEILKKEKAKAVRKTGLLEWIQEIPSIDEVGGLHALKNWFKKIAFIIHNFNEAKKYGIQIPKGCLLIGVPGTGKTLSAKAIASLFKLPLFRLDTSRLFSSFVGETERNVREVLKQIDAMSPCVVLIDEIEKAFAGYHSSSHSDAGVTARVLGNFLYYFQEKKSLSYFVCTSNDISMLPVEMLRKGRFDEIWYVSLPSDIERYEIWKIHLQKARKKLSNEEIKKLVVSTRGFTGAEIEYVVQETLYHTFFEGREPQYEDFLTVIRNITPLSKREAKKIESLERWAEANNIRFANKKEEKKIERTTSERKIIQ